MLNAVICLLFFQLIGQAAMQYLGWPIPGAVAGMIMLWATLMLKGGPSSGLESLASNVIKHLSLLLLPAGVGLFFLPDYLLQHWPALLLAMVLGTFLSMLITGLVAKYTARVTRSE